MNYYNEWDKGAAAWLRELIKAGHIPNGYVDERSITEITPSDLEGFTQCHFFAGIGGWPLALKLAGIPSGTRLWTGSPPCQPFSVAGQSLGFDDPRHLAPVLIRLVRECKPQYLFGEQVAAAIGKHWLDFVFLNLEDKGYSCGSAVLPACSVGAPHKRDRLFFGAVADTSNSQCKQQQNEKCSGVQLTHIAEKECWYGLSSDSSGLCGMANSDDAIPQGRPGMSECADQQPAGAGSLEGRMANANGRESRNGELQCSGQHGQQQEDCGTVREEICGQRGGNDTDTANTPDNFWSDVDWLGCRDGKLRPVESGAFPLANGIPARVGRLRGYGNAIVPQVAEEFIKAFLLGVSRES